MAVIQVTCVLAMNRPSHYKDGWWIKYSFKLWAYFDAPLEDGSVGYVQQFWDRNYLQTGSGGSAWMRTNVND